MDSLETPITLDTRHRTKTYSTKTQTQNAKRMNNIHLAKKTSGDNTNARGMQAVPASYKTPTKCLNNQWVTVNTMHEMVITFCQFKKKYNLLFNSRNRFFHLVNIRVVNISLPFAKFNAFHRTNIIQLTTSVSSKLNIVCIKCKVKNHWYLQQRCPNSYMHRVEFYSHVKTKFA